MSVIAAKVYPNRIDIAADSIIIRDDLKRNNFKKIHRASHICVGGVGSVDEIQMFFSFVNKNEPESSTIEGILGYLKKFSDWKSQYVTDSDVQNSYLIIYKGKLFEVEGMFVQEVTDYVAIGKGEPYALAALYMGHSVKEAVQVACALSCSVSQPIVFESIENEDIKSN